MVMEIETIKHKGLRRFAETENGKGVMQPDRLRDMLAFIAQAGSFDDLATPPNFGFHAMKGDRRGTFSMTVTRNYRLTFVKVDDHTIADLDLEDYH